jgi:thioredoxin reductase (NADPH)
VVGGGNSAVEESLYLSHLAAEVTIVHRRDHFRAEKILQERLLAKANVKVIWNHAVDEILGAEAPLSVERVRIKDVTAGTTQEVAVDGLFVAIGHQPASELFAGQLDMKPNGYLKTVPGATTTNIPGVFAAGDVADDIYRQAVTAAGMGCMAALEAERFLAAQGAA